MWLLLGIECDRADVLELPIGLTTEGKKRKERKKSEVQLDFLPTRRKREVQERQS
jgi:hypothetical protein